MTKRNFTILTLVFMLFAVEFSFAGNPDRQGEAGAAQLLMNPWARSAGLHTMNTANISGLEAMRLNVAGLSRLNRTEVVIGHTRYFDGNGINLNAIGFGSKMGKSSAIGVSIMAVSFGDIPITTTDQPEGTGGTFSPSLFNIGLGFSHMFENKISVGFTLRAVSESLTDVAASALAIDAGVQYVTGEDDNFKFGISLRNVGGKMAFRGQGLSQGAENPSGELPYTLEYFQRSQAFELPSMLNIGGSYDFILDPKNNITLMANFTSNSFSQDQIGAGIEYSFNKRFILRGAYKYEFGSNNVETAPIYTGLAAGLSIDVPMSKESKTRFGLDYAYRHTRLWNGTHNISIRFNL